jgi:four helix bundle protein
MENRSAENSQSDNKNSQSDNSQSEKENSQSHADKLEERLTDFAVRIVRLSVSLPRTTAGKHIAGQILRSGTSPAPNYGEARGAESHADFVHKLRIVLKELNETAIWLRIIELSRIVQPELLADIMKENKDLCRIFTASLKTARNARK